MRPIDVLRNRLAARQYSLADRQQPLDLGMTPRQIQDRLDSGWFVPVHRAVYRLAGSPASSEQAILAACLAAGPAAVASHRSASALWRLRDSEHARPEITVVGDRHCRLAGVIVHRTNELVDVDVSRRSRIPVTTPARTLLDLGAVVPSDVVESALEDALTRAGLPEPVRQHEVAGVRLDFAYPHVRLGIEADSRLWHGGRFDGQRNSDKGNLLLARGWRVLRLTWGDVRRRPSYVVDAVAGELALACPA